MTSVFSQLFKYRPRENRLPQEDFFTEALAGVLQKTPEVCTKFVEWLISHDGCEVEIKEADIDTQKSVHRGRLDRLDIYVDAGSVDGQRHVVGVENKISAKEGERQLERYLEYLGSENDAATRTLVYITRVSELNPFESKPDNVTFKHLKWFQVYDWLKESAKSEHTFLCDLLELMEEWNMTSNLELSATDLAATIRYKKSAVPQFERVLDSVWEEVRINEYTGSWNYKNFPDYYSTPKLGDSNIYLSYGFDFDREDDDWDVKKLYIPSAYVVVRGNDDKPAFLKRLSDDWIDVPQYMEWENGLYVKQMHKKLLVSKDSFGEAYLDFFNTAIQDFKKVAPQDWFIKSS